MRPTFIEPMLPTLAEEAPEGDGWIHEMKYDGYRSQLVAENQKARAFTRRSAHPNSVIWCYGRTADVREHRRWRTTRCGTACRHPLR